MKTNLYKNLLWGTVILSILFFLGYRHYLERRGDAIHIAFAGPMSGEGATAGRLMTQAIQLYFDNVNKKGGINGKKLVLDIFDDRNDPQLAGIKALEIAEQTQAMAVIGHWYSSASISAGEVYKTYHIPAITPGSVNIQVTENNPWYFRNIYNAKASGQFLANYVKKVFHQNTVTIIHEQAAFGAYLANVFENTAQDLGIKVKNKWHFNKKNPNIDNVLADIVNQLDQQQQQAGVVLLAVQALEGVKLVKLIKDKGISNTIIGESSFSEETFRHGFDKYPIEQANPGYYVNDIYVATPLIFDTANEKAQDFRDEYLQKYQEEPDWSAAYAYDSAMILVKALKEAGIEGDLAALPAERALIRDTLASYTRVEEALEGVTGYNYFDHNRDAQKTVSLGVYKNKDSVSALTQLHPMRNTFEINDLKKALEEERILLINDKYMYKTNVVYTGIQVNEISELDFKKTFSCTLDFYLWFRFQGDFTPENIEFTNAIEPIQLGQPVNEKTKDKITYRLYRVKGQFKIDFLSRFFYKQHTLGISFHHKELTRNNLIFVADILGMGLRDEANLLRKMAKKQVLNPTSGWEINHVWFFENVIRKSSLGDPRYLNIKKGTVEYSQFNAGVRIQSSEFSLRGKIPYKYSYDLMALSGIMIIMFVFLSNQFKSFSRLIWFFQVIFAFLLLLTGEVLLVDWLSEHTSMYHLKSIIQSFDVLWWIIPAFLLTLASERFVWTPLEEQMGPVPNIIRIFFALIIYFLAILGITIFVYEKRFTTLLATSGVLAMIIGLAVKINISNIFSGIVINIERPFRIGDWVKINAYEEGEIVDINWRATRLQARNRVIISIPNSLAAESPIVNFYYPDNVFWLWPTVYIHPQHPPEYVKKILLDALLAVETILKEPKPIVLFTGINEWAASYWIAFCADDYEYKNFALGDVWHQVWLHLDRAAIQPAVRRQQIYFFRGEKIQMAPTAPEDVFYQIAEKANQHDSQYTSSQERIN